MSFTRTSVIRGPAVIIYTAQGGSPVNLFSQGDIQVRIANQTFDINTALFGTVDKRSQQRSVEISFTPTGELTTAMANVLWPHGSKSPGDSLIGSGDPQIQIVPKTGYAYTFYGAVVTKQPEMMLSTTKTIVGGITFTAIGKDGVLWSTANSLYTEASSSFAGYAFTPSSVITCPYTGGWGASPAYTSPTWTGTTLSMPNVRDGWTLNFDVQTTPVEADAYGLIDFTVGNIVATATVTPLDISESSLTTILALQGSGADRGQSLLSSKDLLVTPSNASKPTGSVSATLKNCTVLQIGYDYGLTSVRVPQIQFTTMRALSGSSLLSAYSITVN